ncbi:MAG TPA: hypothetical protein VE422_30825 [Terriglobia bacterium]|nr:hypothetical protein [Terriglobia bacterium]
MSQLLGTIFALALIVGAFRYVQSPQQAIAVVKKWGMAVLGLVFGLALVQKVLTSPPPFNDGPSPLPGLLLLCLIAYGIREWRMRRQRIDHGRPRGVERTPVPPQHFGGNE